MDGDSNELISLFVNYAANVAADYTRSGVGWVARKFRKNPPSIDLTNRLNLAIQSELVSRQITDQTASLVADYLLHQADLGLLMSMWAAQHTEPSYSGAFREELRAHLEYEARINPVELDQVTFIVGEVLGRIGTTQQALAVRDPRPAYGTEPPAAPSGRFLFNDSGRRRKSFQAITGAGLADYIVFSTEYRAAVADQFGAIRLQHLGPRQSEVALETLFVPSRFDSEVSGLKGLPLFSLLAQHKRLVLRGPAGSGKSTSVRHAARVIASKLDNNVVPLFLELRTLTSPGAPRRTAFVDELHSQIAELMQTAPPPGWIEYLLVSGRAAVFLDGFDEVLNAGRRSEIRDAIRSFAQLYPACTIVVTSRITGYEIAPLPESIFAHALICELDSSQVANYVRRWFDLTNRPGAAADLTADGFLEESDKYAQDIRSNPLMLSLLCSVYYTRGDIPRTLSDLYERCASLMFHQWNTMRGIDDHGAWSPDLRPALFHIADLILKSPSYLANGIPKVNLVQELQRYWAEQRGMDHAKAGDTARELVDVWAGRAWIVTSVTSDQNNHPRFGFVHQSFLEYFAAMHAVRASDTAEDLLHQLRDQLIYMNGWSVAQLAVSGFDFQRENGGSRFLRALVMSAHSSPPGERIALARFATTLRGMVRIVPEDDKNLLLLLLALYAESLVLPRAEDRLGDIHEETRRISADWSAGAIEDLETESISASEIDQFRLIYQSLVPSPLQTEVALYDLVQSIRDGAPLEMTAPCTEFLGSGAGPQAYVAVSFLAGLLMSEGEDATRITIALRHALTTSKIDLGWYPRLAAASVGAISLDEAHVGIPWHVLVIQEPIVLSLAYDLLTPAWVSGPITRVGDNPGDVAYLGSIGSSLLASIENGNGVLLEGPSLSDGLLVSPASFADHTPTMEAWSDDALVGYVVLIRLAVEAWTTGWLQTETPDPNFRRILDAMVDESYFDPDLPSWRMKVRDTIFKLASREYELVKTRRWLTH